MSVYKLIYVDNRIEVRGYKLSIIVKEIYA